MKKEAVAMLINSNQKHKIEIQTKQPAQNLIKTVKTIEITKEKPTQMISNGHPSFRSAKYSWRTEIFIN